jgi:heme A synthase
VIRYSIRRIVKRFGRIPHHGALAVLAALTLAQIVLGGVVHGTGSSLACPDWPLCFGEVFPDMVGGVLYEHSHRLLGTLIGVVTLVVLLTAAATRREHPTRWRLAQLLFVAVVVQGVLGGLTVIFKLPTLVSTAHLALSMAFLMLVVMMAFRAWPARRAAEPPAPPLSAGLHRWLGITTLAVYCQIVLGGLVRHTGAGVACLTDIPLCQGVLWPTWHATAQVHMLHRMVGVVVGLLVLVVSVRTFHVSARDGRARLLAAGAAMLVLVQVTLGVLSVVTLLGLVPVTAHLGVGALLLADLFLLWLGTRSLAVGERTLRPVGVALEMP